MYIMYRVERRATVESFIRLSARAGVQRRLIQLDVQSALAQATTSPPLTWPVSLPPLRRQTYNKKETASIRLGTKMRGCFYKNLYYTDDESSPCIVAKTRVFIVEYKICNES